MEVVKVNIVPKFKDKEQAKLYRLFLMDKWNIFIIDKWIILFRSSHIQYKSRLSS